MRAGSSRASGAVGLVFLLASALYVGSIGHGFHYDDFHSVVRNPHIRSLAEMPSFFVDPHLFSVNPESAMYRPVLLVTYALNYALGQDRPTGYHLANVLLHGANAALVVCVVRALGQPPVLALLAGLFFAAHPANSEAVNYVSSRSELLMASFFLVACLAYLRSGTTGGWIWYAASLVAGALAVSTKSVAVALVGVAPLGDWLARGQLRWRQAWRAYLGFAVLAVAYVLFTRQLIDRAILEPVRPMAVQAWTQAKAGVYYLLLTGVPTRLSVEPQFAVSRSPGEPAVVGSLCLMLSLVLLLVRGGPRLPRFAGAWFGLLLLPTAVVPLIVLVNEHRLYLAGLGGCLTMAWALHSLWYSRRGVAWILAAGYTLVLCGLVLQRNQAWTDELSLWQDAAGKGPSMFKPQLRLADALVAAGRLDQAEAAYHRALALRPQHPAACNNLGLLLLRRQRLPEAEAQFRAVVAGSPNNVPARLNLGKALMGQGRWQEAAAEYRRALAFGDTGGEAQKHLGFIALNYQSDPGQALGYYDQALALSGDPAPLQIARGVALRRLQRPLEAEAAYRQALQADSSQVEAWYNLGNLYLEAGRVAEARAAYSRVVEVGADSGLTTAAARYLQQLKPE